MFALVFSITVVGIKRVFLCVFFSCRYFGKHDPIHLRRSKD